MMKIAIIGCNSFIAKNFVKTFNIKYQFDYFSHSPQNNNQKNLNSLNELYNRYDCILFFSRASNNSKIIDLLNQIKDKFLGKIIFISTTSLYSNFLSRYSINKAQEEKIIMEFNNWIIIRSGFVDYFDNHSYSSIFSFNKKSKFKFLLGGNLKTHFIYLPNLVNFISLCISNKVNNKLLIASDGFFSLKSYLRIKGFRGRIFNINFYKIFSLSVIFRFLSPLLPSFFESFLSLYFIDSEKLNNFLYASKEYKMMNKNNFFMRRIIFYDFLSINRYDINTKLFPIRFYLKSIILKSDINQYLNTKTSEKFMYHLRLNEFLMIKKISNERNN